MADESTFRKLQEAEEQFFSSRFLAPVLRGRPVTVRIAGVILRLNVKTKKANDFEGWGVFQPTTTYHARFIRKAQPRERETYLELFPAIRLILCRRENERWYGVKAHQADSRFKVSGLVPVDLPDTEVRLFEVVQCRFDGVTCWFEKIDNRYNPQSAVYLREALQRLMEPANLKAYGLTIEERDAYLMAYGPALAADMEAKRDKNEERIKKALERAGADYRSYIERADSFTIEFQVGRETHRSVVRKDTLEVQSAGICLSGQDQRFDLQSLVGVIRTGQDRGRIVRVGANQALSEADYRRAHPSDSYDENDDMY